MRSGTVIFTTVLLLFGFSETVCSQSLSVEYSFNHYTVHDGLAQMQVMSLFQDSKGYLWCSTKAGLSRFDGNHFKNYPNAILPGFDITVMGETKNGELVLFGPSNMAVIKNDSILTKSYPSNAQSSSRFPHSQKFSQKVVLQKQEDGTKAALVMDYSHIDSVLLYPVDPEKGEIVFLEEGNDNYMWQEKKDTIVVSAVQTGTRIRTIPNHFNINTITHYGDSFVGLNDLKQVFLLEKNKFRLLFTIPDQARFIKIIQTPTKDALIIKTDQNLYIYQNRLIAIKKNLTQIRELLFDKENNLWVATEEGLYNFFQLNFVNFKFNMGNKDWVWSVLEDDEKNFWFASYQNGLWKWNGNTTFDYTKYLNDQLAKHLHQRPVPEQYRYYMGASRDDSVLYFPTECNVLRYKNDHFTPVEGLPELPFQMTKILDNTLYCSGFPGLYTVAPGKQITSWSRNELGVSSVLNFEQDKYKNLVVIGQNGLSVIRGSEIEHYGVPHILNSYSLAKDHRGNIWIGGIQNINLFTGDSLILVKTYKEEAFYSMLFVEPHYLFLGGIKGLYIANLQEYYAKGLFETILYNQSNGFTGIECGQNGFLTDSDGLVWIPTSDIVTRFDPKKLIEKPIVPPTIYLNANTSTDNIQWKDLHLEDRLILPYKTNNLRFTIDAVSFANSGNIRYYYKLTGLQKEWTDATETNEVTYYNLKPGYYEFMVKADAGISRASSETLSLKFNIEKPIWAKWWFMLIVALILSLLVIAIVQFFRRREKKQAAIQQRLTQLRSEALAAQLDPHFVMNCLNNISGTVNAGHKARANEYIVKFSKLLRVILQSVKKEQISLSNEIEMVTHYLELEQFRCSDCFSFDIILPQKYSAEQIMVPPMMLQPLVENSIKHGFAKEVKDAHISIQMEINNKKLYISICDNGSGVKQQSPSLGTGLGTKITRERIELLQKRRNIHFELIGLNPGTEVRFHIPLVIKATGNAF